LSRTRGRKIFEFARRDIKLKPPKKNQQKIRKLHEYLKLWKIGKKKLGFCSLINWTLITHKLDIVHSQTEHCSLTNKTLFTHKLNIVHSQTEHSSLTSWRLFTHKLKDCALTNRTLFTHKLNSFHSPTEYCSLINKTLFTHKLSIVHS